MLFILLVSCQYNNRQNKINKFEQKLTANVGKMVQDVKKEHGEPTKYSNVSPLDDSATGGFMVYDYRSDEDNCVLVFQYSKKTLKILDWNYSGDCFEK